MTSKSCLFLDENENICCYEDSVALKKRELYASMNSHLGVKLLLKIRGDSALTLDHNFAMQNYWSKGTTPLKKRLCEQSLCQGLLT